MTRTPPLRRSALRILCSAAALAALTSTGAAGAARPAFPARTPAQLIALASWAPPQVKATYLVKSPRSRYEFGIAVRNRRARLTFLTETTLLEAGVVNNHATWACAQAAGRPFKCAAANVAKIGAALAQAAVPVSSWVVSHAFAPYYHQPGGRFYTARALGRAVSCVRARTASGAAHVCVASDGMLTEAHIDGADVIATSLSDHTTPRDIARSASPR